MPNIYAISQECNTLYNKLIDSIDEETGEVDIEISNALEAKKEEFAEKALNVASVVKMFNAKKNEINAELSRLAEMEDKVDKVIERLKMGLHNACELLGIEKLEGIHSSISFTKSVRTIVDDLESIPDEFKRVVTKTEVKADLTKIKNAINNGEEVTGAHLEPNKSLKIK